MLVSPAVKRGYAHLSRTTPCTLLEMQRSLSYYDSSIRNVEQLGTALLGAILAASSPMVRGRRCAIDTGEDRRVADITRDTETKHFIYFYLGHCAILLFKTQ